MPSVNPVVFQIAVAVTEDAGGGSVGVSVAASGCMAMRSVKAATPLPWSVACASIGTVPRTWRPSGGAMIVTSGPISSATSGSRAPMSKAAVPPGLPRLGRPGGTAAFDIGAREPDVADEIGPLVTIIAPPEGRHVRGTVPIEAQATDQGSGVAAFTLRIAMQPLAATLTPTLPPPASSVTATAIWNTTGFTDGIYTLTAGAEDVARNAGMATRVLVADNTPPETFIDAGPSGQILVGNTTFSFSGSDNQTPGPSLVFAWRLDSGPWSPFSVDTSVTFSGLAESPHLFEVKARDLAGNEDPTPASRTFAVSTTQIVVTSPADSATVPAGALVVRGTVQSAGAEVGVVVNGVAAAVDGAIFAALIPVAPGANQITATATTSAGTVSRSVTVSASGAATLALLASPA